MKKVQEMLVEQEKQRIPIAQPLPLTTDEPEVRNFTAAVKNTEFSFILQVSYDGILNYYSA